LGSFGIKGFTLFKAGSDGWRFRLAGGTVKINKSIDLFGVARADIIEIGLIQDGSTTCVVFSAGVEVLEGVQGGAWVDNMRVCLGPDPSVQIDGVRVSLVVPDSFAFIGGIKKKEEGARKYLEGEVALFLFPVELEIGAAVKIGRNEECRFAFQSAYVVWLTSPRF
jgi:hypothetical protein